MSKLSVPVALKTAFISLLTRRLFYGAAIACAVGLGLGAWLEPPKFQTASAATTVTLPPDQPDTWSDPSSVSSQVYGQPAGDPNWSQTAAVSPPADAAPVQLAQADESEVAASGDTGPAHRSEVIAPAADEDGATGARQPDAADPPAPPRP